MSYIDAMKGATVMARRARMKARTEAWWHTEHCPNCRAKRELLGVLQGEMGGLRKLIEEGGADVQIVKVDAAPDNTKH